MPLSSDPAPGSLPYLDHLRQESARFREVLADAPSGAQVPTCPEWDTDDLIWHLGEVQWFWGEIAQRRLTEPTQLDAMNAEREARPGDRAALLAFYDRASTRLHDQLSALPPETPLWMWHTDQSAGYIRRRQAHEALMHRIDAELTAGVDRAPVDCRLAADGVDEALRIMRGFPPEYHLTADPLGPSVTVAVVDGFHTWTVTPVRVTGVDPDGDMWDERRFLVADGPDDASVAEVAATAEDLDCWLWNRPPAGEVTRTGDTSALALVHEIVGSTID